MPIVRRDFKSTLFCHLFGSEDNRDNALELYNALREADHADPAEVEFTTIDNFVYLGYRNDVSFIIDGDMMLVEHQSTLNPNMPLRGLLYFAKLYTKYVDERELDLYGAARLAVPTPRFVVLYFGEDERPDREALALSDLLVSGPGDLEVTATVLNCNEGHNGAIMGACETLRGYAHLLALARRNRESGLGYREAAGAAIDECIAEGVLAEYLGKHRAEVMEMLFTMEYEEKAQRIHQEAIRREAWEEGLEAGREAGFEQGLRDGREQGLRDGLEEGREQGAKQERERIRRALQEAGIDPAVIDEQA